MCEERARLSPGTTVGGIYCLMVQEACSRAFSASRSSERWKGVGWRGLERVFGGYRAVSVCLTLAWNPFCFKSCLAPGNVAVATCWLHAKCRKLCEEALRGPAVGEAAVLIQKNSIQVSFISVHSHAES